MKQRWLLPLIAPRLTSWESAGLGLMLCVIMSGSTSVWSVAALSFGAATTQSQGVLREPLEGGVPDLAVRLAELRPDDPMAYFELAEELAYLSVLAPAQRQTSLDMATHLFVLAYELDRRLDQPKGLGTSVCLALADIARPDDRDWLLALAASFGSEASLGLRVQLGGHDAEDEAMLDTAEAISRYRAVERRPLAAIMRRIDVRQQMLAAGVRTDDADWMMQKLQDGLNKPHCPECRNQRLVRLGTPSQEIEQRLCSTCFGNPEPDPPLSRDELKRTLAIEAMLLRSRSRTWSAQHAVSGWKPVADLDPAGLAVKYGVDSDAPFWHSHGGSAFLGTWRTRSEDGSEGDRP